MKRSDIHAVATAARSCENGPVVIAPPDDAAADWLQAMSAILNVRRSGPEEYTIWARRAGVS